MIYTSDNTLMLRYSFYDGNPSEMDSLIPEENKKLAIERWWVPQTIGGQVWCFYVFRDLNDKNLFIQNLHPRLKKSLDKDRKPIFYETWCGNKQTPLTIFDPISLSKKNGKVNTKKI